MCRLLENENIQNISINRVNVFRVLIYVNFISRKAQDKLHSYYLFRLYLHLVLQDPMGSSILFLHYPSLRKWKEREIFWPRHDAQFS